MVKNYCYLISGRINKVAAASSGGRLTRHYRLYVHSIVFVRKASLQQLHIAGVELLDKVMEMCCVDNLHHRLTVLWRFIPLGLLSVRVITNELFNIFRESNHCKA